MSGRARRVTRTTPDTQVDPYEQKLKDAGGVLWTNDDLSKKRIYFNGVECNGKKMDVYYDCKAQQWQTGKYVDEFIEALKEQKNL